MDTQVCPRRILVSNLPKKESVDRILDKLEIYFSKSRNGGGEVEEVVMLEDSGNVVITFLDSNSVYIYIRILYITLCGGTVGPLSVALNPFCCLRAVYWVTLCFTLYQQERNFIPVMYI